jgi:hypothetical protein
MSSDERTLRTEQYVEESDAAHPLAWVPGRYTLEGELV